MDCLGKYGQRFAIKRQKPSGAPEMALSRTREASLEVVHFPAAEATAPLSTGDLGMKETKQIHIMFNLQSYISNRRAAAGPAFLVWLFGGGLGAALLVFVVLKLIGH
jgi:hypothetical protein